MKPIHAKCKRKIQILEKRIAALEGVLKHVCHMSDMAVRIRQFVERTIKFTEKLLVRLRV